MQIECLCQGLGCRKWKSPDPPFPEGLITPSKYILGAAFVRITSRSSRYLQETLTPNSRCVRHSFNTHTHTHNLFRPAGSTRKGNYAHLLIQFLKWILVSQSPYVLLFWLLSLTSSALISAGGRGLVIT